MTKDPLEGKFNPEQMPGQMNLETDSGLSLKEVVRIKIGERDGEGSGPRPRRPGAGRDRED
jgi:hypothetical protein